MEDLSLNPFSVSGKGWNWTQVSDILGKCPNDWAKSYEEHCFLQPFCESSLPLWLPKIKTIFCEDQVETKHFVSTFLKHFDFSIWWKLFSKLDMNLQMILDGAKLHFPVNTILLPPATLQFSQPPSAEMDITFKLIQLARKRATYLLGI